MKEIRYLIDAMRVQANHCEAHGLPVAADRLREGASKIEEKLEKLAAVSAEEETPRCQKCRTHRRLYESGLVRLEVAETEIDRLRAMVCEMADVVESHDLLLDAIETADGRDPINGNGLHLLGPDLSARVESVRLEASKTAREACPGSGRCHGAMDWCDYCGTVRDVCDADVCDMHEGPRRGT